VIYHIRAKENPEAVFEWHTETNKLYAVQLHDPGVFRAVVIRDDVQSQEDARRCVTIWLRGFEAGKKRNEQSARTDRTTRQHSGGIDAIARN
jgi:hypothetical protein